MCLKYVAFSRNGFFFFDYLQSKGKALSLLCVYITGGFRLRSSSGVLPLGLQKVSVHQKSRE